ncbi:TRAPP complex subunit trs33 [Coprinopsis marcescibilis]|uniref:TRAPP complex subunit trs33 n=1 Tax=Coprinopsis marcescibilis TaxID=230819 RepID=A0A5C3L6Q4_COPMA|nr:TRAPP complex subunit trs33 [Coprinopsis marcescibilis]
MASRASTSSAIPTTLASLADPPTKQIDGTAYEYFLIEMVATLRESAAFATARTKEVEKEMAEAGLVPVPTPTTVKKESIAGARDSTTSLQLSRPKSTIVDEEEEPLRARLENIGIHVGGNFSERLCVSRPPFNDTLDAIKFVCKDVWNSMFNKQIDNLRTNHRGVYVLQDNTFKPIQRVSSHLGRADAVKKAKIYSVLAAGIIQGTLSRLGYPPSSVTPEISSLPNCTFQVRMAKS